VIKLEQKIGGGKWREWREINACIALVVNLEGNSPAEDFYAASKIILK
jgi:hypothetical protein